MLLIQLYSNKIASKYIKKNNLPHTDLQQTLIYHGHFISPNFISYPDNMQNTGGSPPKLLPVIKPPLTPKF